MDKKEKEATYDIKVKKKSNLLDKMVMWLGVPAALFLAERTKTLETVVKVAKQLTAQGKEKYDAYRSDFRMASIKPLFYISISLAVLLGLFAVIARAFVIESNAAVDIALVVLVVLVLVVAVYITCYLPPLPVCSKVNGVYEVEPDTIKETIDGVLVEIPNPLAGRRIIANEKAIDLEHFSLLFGLALISVCGYMGSIALFVMAGFGRSVVPAILGLLLLVATRKLTRAVGKMITWAFEKMGDFVEWATGTFAVHLAVLEAGKTYESVKTGPIELFNQKLPWEAFSTAESSGAFALLALAFPMVIAPSPEMFQIAISIIFAGAIVLMMMQEIDASDRIKERRERVVEFFEGRATTAAFIMIPMGVLLPEQTKAIGPHLKAAITGALDHLWHPSRFCQYVNITSVWTNIGMLLLSLAMLWLIYKVWDGMTTAIGKKREKQNDSSLYRKSEKGLVVALGLVGIVLFFVAIMSGASVFASLKSDSSFCKAEVVAPTGTKQEKVPVSSASQQAAAVHVPPQEMTSGASSPPAEEQLEQVGSAGKVVNKISPPPAKVRMTSVTVETAPPPQKPVETASRDATNEEGFTPAFAAYRQRRAQRK